jgi:hypothetical protein
LVLRSGRPEDLRTRRIDPKLGGFRDRRFRGLEDMRTSDLKGQSRGLEVLRTWVPTRTEVLEIKEKISQEFNRVR